MGTTLAPAPIAEARKRPLRVVVADDSVLVREGVARLLAEAGFDVVARAADADELLREVGRVQTDVAITDIRMPPTQVDEGRVAAAEIRRLHPQVGVLVLSQHLDSAHAMRLLEDYPERVGYLLKERVSDIAVLSDASRRIAEGECVIDPTIVPRLMSRARGEGPLATLNAREQTILPLIAEGRPDEAITQHLGVTTAAYEAELRDLFAKLGRNPVRHETPYGRGRRVGVLSAGVRCHYWKRVRVRMRVQACLYRPPLASGRCSDEPRDLQHLSIRRSWLQLVWPDFGSMVKVGVGTTDLSVERWPVETQPLEQPMPGGA